MPCFGRGRKKRSMHQHAVSCRSYKKECCSFLLIQTRKSAAIFSRAFAVHGAWKWCKHFVRFVLERRGEEKGRQRRIQQRMCSTNTKLTIPQTKCVCVSLLTSQSACVCVCQGPSELQAFLQSHRSGEWRENTKDTLSHKSISAPSLPVPLGKVILSSKTFSSHPRLSLLLPLFLSAWSFTLQFPLCHSVSVCLAALCHYYGPICVNANIPFIMGGMVSARTRGAHIPHLSHFHHGGIRSAMGSEVRVPDLLSDHWLLSKPPPCSPTPHLFLLPAPPDLLHFQVVLAPSLDCSWLFSCPPAVIFPNQQFFSA